MVILENGLWILIPLFIGQAIDGLQTKNYHPFFVLAGVIFLASFIMILRRLYDTRVYQHINAQISQEGLHEQQNKKVDNSTISARLSFTKEIVDFFEEDFPSMLQGGMQFIGSLLLLTLFDLYLGLSVGVLSLIVLLIFLGAKKRYHFLNSRINNTTEKQVNILNLRFLTAINRYFYSIKNRKVQLSDLESFNFGSVMFLAALALLFNLGS